MMLVVVAVVVVVSGRWWWWYSGGVVGSFVPMLLPISPFSPYGRARRAPVASALRTEFIIDRAICLTAPRSVLNVDGIISHSVRLSDFAVAWCRGHRRHADDKTSNSSNESARSSSLTRFSLRKATLSIIAHSRALFLFVSSPFPLPPFSFD